MNEIKAPRVAVVGVSSLVGTALIEALKARRFACADFRA